MTNKEYRQCLVDWIEEQDFKIEGISKVGDHYYELQLACLRQKLSLNPVFNVQSIHFDDRKISVWVSLETFLDEANEYVDHWRYKRRIE